MHCRYVVWILAFLGPVWGCHAPARVLTGEADAAPEAGGEVAADAHLDGPTSCTRTTSLSLSLLRPSLRFGELVVDEAHDVLLGIPGALGPATDRLAAVSLRGDVGEPISLVVVGDPPPVEVADAVYDPVSARVVVLAYPEGARGTNARVGDHMELLTVTLDGAGHAVITRLEPTAAPSAAGLPFSWIFPEGDGMHYRALRSAEVSARASVTGDHVRWEPEVALGGRGDDSLVPDSIAHEEWIVHDPTGNRLLIYGEVVADADLPEIWWFEPNVYELQLAGGTVWSRIAASGSPPPSEVGGDPSYAGWFFPAYDDVGRRLIVFQEYWFDGPRPDDMTRVTGAWSLSDAGVWTVVTDIVGGHPLRYSYMRECVDDRERRRSLVIRGDDVVALDLRPGHEGTESVVAPGGAFDTTSASPVFDRVRGAILVLCHSRGLARMAVREGDFVWRVVDVAAPWPGPPGWDPALVYDGAADRLVRIGNSTDDYLRPTVDVHTVDLGSPTPRWVPGAVAGSVPSSRVSYSCIFDEARRTVYLVGGYRTEGHPSREVDLGDVLALDLATMTWREVAMLPVPRAEALLRLVGDELFVMFGWQRGGRELPVRLHDVWQVSVVSGHVRPVVVSGDSPSTSGGSLAGVDLPGGWRILSPSPNPGRFGVDVYRVEFGPGRVAFTRSTSCDGPVGPGWGPGAVVDPVTGYGYVVGQSVWEVRE